MAGVPSSAGQNVGAGHPMAGSPQSGGIDVAAGHPMAGLPHAAGVPNQPPVQPAVIREDELLAQKRAEFNWPGVVALAFVDGAVVARGVAGVRESGQPRAVTDADRFHLGSCTKAMTGTLIGRLVDRGIVSFDDTVGEIFDDIPIHAAYRNVTLHQLLRHEGGTPGSLINNEPVLWRYMWDNIDGDQRPIRLEVTRRL